MVENQNCQSELFSSPDSPGPYKGQYSKHSFFMRIRGYEKFMLLIMGGVLISIVAFSLGVEKGKRVSEVKNSSIVPAGYTIQVAAFKNKQLALGEIQRLTKEGLAPMAFAKGDYIVLCVGKFSNQESAQPLLIQLQRAYAGCRIRRL